MGSKMSAVEHPIIDMQTIQAVARLIAEAFDPERVVLFGSYARGQASAHSDIDLLVELRTGPKPKGNPIRRAIAERFVLPVDVVVTSPEIMARQQDNPYSVIHQALNEGIVLYDRHAA